jgi:hypothetical protein
MAVSLGLRVLIEVIFSIRCNDGKADLTHVFELNELGRGQAFLHLRQFHEAAYEAFLQSLPDVQNAALISLRDGDVAEPSSSAAASSSSQRISLPISTRTIQQRMAEAERSRLRRLRATNEERKNEAIRSKKRRENLTPVQRQADYERRKRKKKRAEESVRSKKRREDASKETKEKEVLRSRERRRNATEEQRQREALRSRLRRQNATEQQKLKERERCRKRYEAKKAGRASSSGQRTDDGGDSGQFSDTSSTGVSAAYASSLVSGEAALRATAAKAEGTRSGYMAMASSLQIAQSMDTMQQQQHLLASQAFQNGGMPMVSTHQHTNSTSMNASTTRGPNVHPSSFQPHSMAAYSQMPAEPRPSSNRLLAGPLFPPPQQTAAMMASGQADIQLGFAVNPNLQHMALQHDHQSHPFFFDNDAALLAGSGFASLPSVGATRSSQTGDSTAV